MIRFFESIPKFDSYSHYGICLDKYFKNKSLKKFIKTLKYHEQYKNKINSEGSLFLPFESKDKNNEQNEEDNMIPEHFLKDTDQLGDIFSINYPSKREKKINENSKKTTSYFHTKNTYKKDYNLDPFKYTPNYDAISKKIPFVTIHKPESTTKKKLLNSKKLEQFKNSQKNSANNLIQNNDIKHSVKKINEKSQSQIYFRRRNKKKNLIPLSFTEAELFKNNIPKISPKNKTQTIIKNNKIENKPKNNNIMLRNVNSSESFRLTKQSSKSGVFTFVTDHVSQCNSPYKTGQNLFKRKYEENLVIDNKQIPFYNRNKAIDFSKMQRHSFKNLLNKDCLKNPKAGYYNPKYDFIEKSPRNIFFGKKPIDEYKSKKLLLNHIMRSYHTDIKYLIIDNSKLNDDIFKEYNIQL